MGACTAYPSEVMNSGEYLLLIFFICTSFGRPQLVYIISLFHVHNNTVTQIRLGADRPKASSGLPQQFGDLTCMSQILINQSNLFLQSSTSTSKQRSQSITPSTTVSFHVISQCTCYMWVYQDSELLRCATLLLAHLHMCLHVCLLVWDIGLLKPVFWCRALVQQSH